MEKQATKSSRNGKNLLALGFGSIAFLFLVYVRLQNSELTPDAIEVMERLAFGFYIILLICLGAISYGLIQYHKQKVEENKDGLLSIIAITTWNPKSKKIFVLAFVIYGIFFSLSSGTLVYQPEVIFSHHYGVNIPSAFIAPCCDQPGYMPKIIVYLTDHVGLQVVPINLVLQLIVSYLVGLNAAIAVSALTISKKGSGLSSIGATTGLFIACPTCAGTFLSLFVGTASGIAITFAITQLQTMFIAISIPVLLATPFILARKLRNEDGSCAVDPIK